MLVRELRVRQRRNRLYRACKGVRKDRKSNRLPRSIPSLDPVKARVEYRTIPDQPRKSPRPLSGPY